MATKANAVVFSLGDGSAAIPASVWHAANRSLLDLVGVWAAARKTASSRIAHETALELWPAGERSATLAFDGRRVSAAGAAFAGAQTIDSLDAHDGFKPAKGHAGVAILPALLAVQESENAVLAASDFLWLLIVGYEVACRAAIAQHRTCPDYHASGSWNAIGAAAVAARLLRLSHDATRHALGIAEYYGPRSQMMRVIDRPTMLKDSSSWGAMAGVTAAYLARRGFTGAPSIVVEADDAADVWSDLGERWRILEQYFKPWPVCRWAQPAVQAALELAEEHDLQPPAIERVTIETFHEAKRLAGHAPATTEEAQYSIAFPTACALVRRRVGVDEVSESGLADPEIRRLAAATELIEIPEFNAVFPAVRRARLRIECRGGRIYESRVVEPLGDPEQPLTDEELIEKHLALVTPALGEPTAREILDAVGPLGEQRLDLPRLLSILRRPVRRFD